MTLRDEKQERFSRKVLDREPIKCDGDIRNSLIGTILDRESYFSWLTISSEYLSRFSGLKLGIKDRRTCKSSGPVVHPTNNRPVSEKNLEKFFNELSLFFFRHLPVKIGNRSPKLSDENLSSKLFMEKKDIIFHLLGRASVVINRHQPTR